MTAESVEGDRVEGNQQVVDLLDKWLSFAKQGDMRFCALVACRTSEDVVTDCAWANPNKPNKPNATNSFFI